MPKTSRLITDRFLEYLRSEEQADLLPEIVSLLTAEAARRQEISVISAEPLDEQERKALTKTLTEKWGEHPFIFTVDDVLLSGLIIKFRDTIIDISGKHQLTNLAHELK